MGLLAGDLGALLGCFRLGLRLEPALLLGLATRQLGTLLLLDAAFFQRRVAQRHHRLADFADLVVPLGTGHFEVEAAARDLQQAIAQAVERTDQAKDDGEDAGYECDRRETGKTVKHDLVERLDAFHFKFGVGDVRFIGIIESDELGVERGADRMIHLVVTIGARVRGCIELREPH